MKALIITEKLGTYDSKCSTTLANEGIAEGHQIFECFSDKVSLLDGHVIAEASQFFGNDVPNSAPQIFTLKADFDVIFFRPNPPVDMAYLSLLYLLQLVEDEVLVVNKPSSVIRFAEKFLPHYFANFSPPTLISKDHLQIAQFLQRHGDIVAKPLYLYGGKGISKLSKTDEAKLDEVIATSKEPMIYQKFLPEVAEGDKRLFFANSKFQGAFARVPQGSSFLANLAQGGALEPYQVKENEKKLIKEIEVFLAKHHISICGADLIGSYITEINITSPIGFTQMKELYDTNSAQYLWRSLESQLKY